MMKTFLKQVMIEEFIDSLFKSISKNFVTVKLDIDFNVSNIRYTKDSHCYHILVTYYFKGILYSLVASMAKHQCYALGDSLEKVFDKIEKLIIEKVKEEISVGIEYHQSKFSHFKGTYKRYMNISYDSKYGGVYDDTWVRKW
jgi:ribosome-associated translation inhibitor RaiA